MSLADHLADLSRSIEATTAAIAAEHERVASLSNSAERIEFRLKQMRENERELTATLATLAEQVAAARSVVEGAEAKAKKIVADTQTEANTIFNAANEHSRNKQAEFLKKLSAAGIDLRQ